MFCKGFIFLLTLLTCSINAQVYQGKIDLSDTLFIGDKSITLDGQWHFSPNVLLQPNDKFDGGFIKTPGTWDKQLAYTQGVASYGLTITMPSQKNDYALLIKNLSSAWRLYLNGKLVSSGGKLAHNNTEKEVASRKYHVVRLPNTDKVKLLLHLSNYSQGDGGIKRAIRFGTLDAVTTDKEMEIITAVVLSGGFAFLFLYLLGFFLVYPKESAYFYLGLYCACISLFMLSDSHVMAVLMPDIDAVERYRFSWGALALLLPSYALYLKNTFSFPSQYKLVLIPTIINIICFTFIVFGPPLKMVIFLDIVVISSVFIQIFCTYFIFYCWRHKHPNSFAPLVLNLVFLATLARDAWFVANRIQDNYFIAISLPVAVFCNVVFFAVINHKRYLASDKIKQILEQRVYKKTKELSQSVERLTNANNYNKRFFHYISHEFRAPLTLILDPLEGLKKGRYGQLNANAHQAIEVARDNSNRLLTLINQILALGKSQSEQQSLHIVTLNLNDSLAECLSRVAPFYKNKSIEVTVKSEVNEPLLLIDNHHLDSILLNLITNAFKYTPNDGCIHIKLSEQTSHFCLSIKNYSPNFREADLQYLFEDFFRGAQEHSEELGTGLGLALVRELLEQHQGEINCHFSPPWLTFDTQLCKKPKYEDTADAFSHLTQDEIKADNRQLEATQHTTANRARQLIVIAEDHHQTREYLAQLLSEHQYQVMTAKNGVKALELCINHQPKLLITDYIMPELDGIGLIEKVRQDSIIADTPIFVLTSESETSQQVQAITLGADDYIVKPFIQEELLARIKRQLHIRHQLSQQEKQAIESHYVSKQDKPSFSEQLENVIFENLESSELNVGFLAEKMAMDRTTLHRKVKAQYTFSTTELIKQKRLTVAKDLLLLNNHNIAEIAHMTGFNSQAYFSNQFKARFNCSPKEWRQQQATRAQQTTS